MQEYMTNVSPKGGREGKFNDSFTTSNGYFAWTLNSFPQLLYGDVPLRESQ